MGDPIRRDMIFADETLPHFNEQDMVEEFLQESSRMGHITTEGENLENLHTLLQEH